MAIEELLEQAKSYLPEEELSFINKAYHYAEDSHEGQTRRSGVPYITHPIEVANILVGLEMDATSVAAGFLHDVVEDTEVTLEDLKEAFGEETAMLVDGVTKLRKFEFKSKEEQQAENHRKMFVAMAQDIRCILIKLADRLHNMRTLKYMPKDKQLQKANETLEIFAPLAHRLGISTIKWELEDISLRYLNPQQYYRIVNLMKKKRTERETVIKDVIEDIKGRLADVNIDAEIYGRPKHLYSIYRKMVIQNKPFNEIYDLLAVRILVNSIKDCYAVLGIIHTRWKPMPGRFKDYIAMPKQNMYQSLHTTVVGPKGDPLEVQVRTKDMHKVAEYGIAAHWAYKEGKKVNAKMPLEEKLSWFRGILESQSDTDNAEEFMENLKVDLFSDMVFVFSPKGDVLELPAGSVPLDFAYRVHTEIGNQTVGAKVNGNMVPLDYKLKTGDIVEIMTSKHSYGPSRDWLKVTQSSQAKNKIRQWFKRQKREENIEKGRELVDQELRNQDFDPKAILTPENLDNVARKYNFSGENEIYTAVGYSGLSAKQVVTKLTEKIRKKLDQEKTAQRLLEATPENEQAGARKKPASGVRVKGADNLLIRLSKCCNPVPGDEIVGFITKGRGVSIHREDCPNIQGVDETERLLEVEWEGTNQQRQSYNVYIEIHGFDRSGLLNEVLHSVTETKTMIRGVSANTDRNKMATIHMTIAINNINHLQRVVEKIKSISDIYTVRRVTQ
ncbi:MAG TPA: bifunctional (p)ppGpp synthetase/guanosine-3',5'-bis(diphosphate) 3'-pyrophosphohydrolase [Bacillales bacterium]|nr:bifunctional (p)ppGpp synthetase/guanosine-3',5'-bis(diphosphate) 3'-pyrophosphohydrolase [Bacillales bacterium]